MVRSVRIRAIKCHLFTIIQNNLFFLNDEFINLNSKSNKLNLRKTNSPGEQLYMRFYMIISETMKDNRLK